VDLEVTVVVDQAQLSKLVHEKAYPRPGGTDHLRQCDAEAAPSVILAAEDEGLRNLLLAGLNAV
jgi:hypothetical protein